MSEPLEDLQARLVSQHPNDSPLDIRRELIDVSQLEIGQSQESLPAFESLAENLQIAALPPFPFEDVVGELVPVIVQPPLVGESQPKHTRKRRKYAQKRLLGNFNLFLNPEVGSLFSDEEVLVQGQIVQVAMPRNGNQFRINWKKMSADADFPVPVGHLRTIIDKTATTDLLICEAIDKFESQKTGAGQASVPLPALQETSLLPLSVQVPSPRRRIGVHATPVSTVLAQEAAASIRTSSSTISSLTTVSFRGRRATRNNLLQTVESDTEDGTDLDENDNAQDGDDGHLSDIEEVDDSTEHGDLNDLLKAVVWNYDDLESDDEFQDEAAPSFYDGPVGNKRVNNLFNDPFECLTIAGLSYEFVARLAASSNDYAKKVLSIDDRNKRVHGKPFANISTEEMYRFLGVMLQISLSPRDSGGYPAYFRKTNKTILDTEILDTIGFASKYMELWRFKQIRSAFHPEDKALASMGEADKCYQLRHAINSFNTAASNLRHIPGHVSFDEGGVMCKSRFCPVRQYNKDKPDKFRVDFFIMACPSSFFIHHLDVYQGKNASNVGIKPEARCLPTTQKAVLNAVLFTRIGNDPDGSRLLAMDNRYNCPELGTLMRGRYGIYCAGTSRVNRKGWPKADMDLKMKANGTNRGLYKMLVDKTNKVQCIQWIDSRVVNVVTTLLNNEISHVLRQKGRNKLRLTCPVAVIKYQLYMLGVDKGDQMRAHGGGFSRKAHFQKWYKRVYLSILDCMLLNALVVWNESALDNSLHRSMLKRFEFYEYCAQRMLNYKDKESPIAPERLVTRYQSNHVPSEAVKKTKCIVCKLEHGLGLGGKDLKLGGLTTNIVTCATCKISAHNFAVTKKRKIHSLPCFEGMTCWQIAHSEVGNQLWLQSKGEVGHSYGIQTTHAIYGRLRELYNKPKALAKKRKLNPGPSTATTNDETQSIDGEIEEV